VTGKTIVHRLFGNQVFMSGAWVGLCVGVGITHLTDGGGIVLSVAILAWSSIGVYIGDWMIVDGRDHCQKQMDGL
jgi:hypothetical protein